MKYFFYKLNHRGPVSGRHDACRGQADEEHVAYWSGLMKQSSWLPLARWMIRRAPSAWQSSDSKTTLTPVPWVPTIR